MFDPPLQLTCPGLLVTGTDTGVGKTVVTCAVAACLREQAASDASNTARRIGVFKPFVTGCQRRREGLVGEDTEALAHFADSRHPLEVISPVRFVAPLAPAAAAEEAGQEVDLAAVRRALQQIEADSDVVLVEGVGGLLVPLASRPVRSGQRSDWWTVLDLAIALDYPVLVTARAGLGTLNHTAMTVRLLREGGCRVAGIVINGFEPDAAQVDDPSMAGNRLWLARLTGVPVVAVLPRCEAAKVQPHQGRLSRDVVAAASMCPWMSLAQRPR